MDHIALLNIIKEAFIDVYRLVLTNGIPNTEEVETIIKISLADREIYDMTNDEYTKTDIINSAQTETEIIKNVI